MKNDQIFESSIQKIARILARQYNIEVIFEGDEAKTDGKRIYLPYFTELSQELKEDLQGYCDHETAHIKFTDFKVIKEAKGWFTNCLLNAVEDVRIERKMIKEFPGSAFYLNPLKEKWRKEILKVWPTMDLDLKIIFQIKEEMDGNPIQDEETEFDMDIIEKQRKKLNKCVSTKELSEVVKEIVDVLAIEEEEQQKQKKYTEFNLDSFVNNKIKGQQKEDGKVLGETKKPFGFEFSKLPHTPYSTRFDSVTNFSSKGNKSKYLELKQSVNPIISLTKKKMDAILKVNENVKWSFEKEQGAINSRELFKLHSNKSYRNIFKEKTKTETRNIAIEILIDLSGSMSGKVDLTKKALIAISESLKDLRIAFEITGFHSTFDKRLEELRKEDNSKREYNRVLQRLDHYVFKNFRDNDLSGIERIFHGDDNVDGESLRWAAKRLSKRSEKRKILMVFSDGMPAAEGKNKILNGDLKSAVREIEKTNMEVIGFGISTDCVRHFYRSFVVIDNLAQFPTKAMRKLEQVITRV